MAEAEKTALVVRHLIRLVKMSGPEPELLPGELALAAKLSVSRVTVRRGMEQLLARQMLLKLPGRKGTFTNPTFARQLPYTIGIGVSDGNWDSIGENEAIGLSAFLKKMSHFEDFPWLYEFCNGGPEMDLEVKIGECCMQAMVWFSPTAFMIPKLQELALRDFPIVIVGPSGIPENGEMITYNGILRDHAAFGEELAAFILERGWKRPIYCGGDGETFQTLCRILKENGIVIPPENILATWEEMRDNLAGLVAGEAGDCIYTDGSDSRYHLLAAEIGKVKEKNIPVILERLPASLSYQREYPYLNIHFLRKDTVQLFSRKAGALAGELLFKQLRKKKKFPSRILPM